MSDPELAEVTVRLDDGRLSSTTMRYARRTMFRTSGGAELHDNLYMWASDILTSFELLCLLSTRRHQPPPTPVNAIQQVQNSKQLYPRTALT